MKIPRYVRVNTLKMSTPDVIAWFSGNGFKLLGTQQEMAQVGELKFSKNSLVLISVVRV